MAQLIIIFNQDETPKLLSSYRKAASASHSVLPSAGASDPVSDPSCTVDS